MASVLVGVLGASSLVGKCLMPALVRSGWQVRGYSRQINQNIDGVEWRQPSIAVVAEQIPYWICVAPIWVLSEYFSLIEASGAERIVALSSTSRFSKVISGDPAEISIANKLIEGEALVQAWAESRGIEWIILRPTLIYGLGLDQNICEIARFIRRSGFFPVFGQALGLRQPIHVEEVSEACARALQAIGAENHAYNLSGGETLTYSEMVLRVFEALGRRPRLLKVPLWIFRLGVVLLRRLPRYRKWSPAMAERMNLDLVFDSTEAKLALGFRPRAFLLNAKDLPP